MTIASKTRNKTTGTDPYAFGSPRDSAINDIAVKCEQILRDINEFDAGDIDYDALVRDIDRSAKRIAERVVELGVEA